MQRKNLMPGILEIRNQTQTPTRKLTDRTEEKRKKPRNKAEVNRFWNFTANEEENTAELLLYGEISEYSWYEDDITPKEFNKDLKAMGEVEQITVRINSGGGDVFAAVAIYTRLKEHKANIAVKIDGWCASAATIIAMAGDSIEISVGGIFMIHDPAAGILGYYKADELKKIADELETIKQSIVNCYMTVTDKSEDEIKSLMTDETWYTGEEAVEAGFCTAVMLTEVETQVEDAEKIIVNSVPINLGTFHTVPKGLLGYANSHNNKTNAKNNKEDKNMGLTLEKLKSEYPDVANAYKAEIMAAVKTGETDYMAAVDAERARIKAIDEITLTGFEDLADKAKYENPVSAEAFAMQMVAAQKKAGNKFLNDREADLKDSGVDDVPPVSNKGGAGEDDPFGSIIDELYPQAK
ncbi:MAG: Clp protease ClpP [Lachnospiraceae bacterium]|nr:Clp protease ClpP [Lachnospiraceae bacterium]